eukprot:scaffold95524_cov66-Phaeocystis_antarctica.AAC.1
MPGRTSSLSAAVAAAAAREPGAAAMVRRSSNRRAPASSSWSSAACVRMARTASKSCPRSFGSSAARASERKTQRQSRPSSEAASRRQPVCRETTGSVSWSIGLGRGALADAVLAKLYCAVQQTVCWEM